MRGPITREDDDAQECVTTVAEFFGIRSMGGAAGERKLIGLPVTGEPGQGAGADGVAVRASDLLARMQAGDREAAALFMDRFEPRVRRRIRRRLNRVVRRLFDSQDLLSTVCRRLDRYVRSGRLTATTEAELWSFVNRVVENAFIDKSRAYDRMRRSEGAEGAADRPHTCASDSTPAENAQNQDDHAMIRDRISRIADPMDREITDLWIRGTPHGVIADLLGVSPARVRKRWQRIRQTLRETAN